MPEMQDDALVPSNVILAMQGRHACVPLLRVSTQCVFSQLGLSIKS
jgi:hypothetical protein